MSIDLKTSVVDFLSGKTTVVGFASVDRFDGAPAKHHPAAACKNAKTVIVYGNPISKGVLSSPEYNLYFLHSGYHVVYSQLDEISFKLANFIESRQKAQAVAIPSYAPLKFHGPEPWGIISLKHAAVNAGLGAFGRSGQMYHPVYGSLLRIGAVVTDVEIASDPMDDTLPCPEKCNACQQKCPPSAFDEGGKFQKLTCLAHTIKHAIYPLALKDEQGRKHIERIINTAAYNYWLACNECLKACPLNKKPVYKSHA
jgi:epoxyqueuosine reductase